MRRKVLDFFNDLFELEPVQIQVDYVTYQKFYFCSCLQVGKRKNQWFVKLRISTPYTLPVTFLTYKTKSELEIKLQIFESINGRSEIDKTYRDL